MSWGANFIDTMNGQVLADLAREDVGTTGVFASSDFRKYRGLLYVNDTEADARQFCFGFTVNGQFKPPQSGCMLYLLGLAQRTGRDGRILWRGRQIDPLYDPYASHIGLAPSLVEELGRQAGLLRDGTSAPDIEMGAAVFVGGNDGLPPERQIYGGLGHGFLVVGVREDGTLDTVEGGQVDPGNGGHPTAVKACHRELYSRGGGYWLRTAGSRSEGRMVRWHFPLHKLPAVSQ